MYVGNFFLLLGLAIASNSWVFALVGIPLSLGMHKAIVAAEENFLRNKFGAQFDDYCARVPRWVPRLSGLAHTLSGMEFQWRRVVQKEYAAGFDWFSATAVVVLSICGAPVAGRQRGAHCLDGGGHPRRVSGSGWPPAR